MAERRQIRLVVRSAAQEAVEDRRWLASQGFSPATLPKRATWYRYDGLPLHNLPTDPYHRRRYRERGCTLKPPSGTGVLSVESATQETQPADANSFESVVPKPRTSRLSRRVLRVLDGKDSWEGTATELMAILDSYAPPGGWPHKVLGMPRNPARLSKEIITPNVTAALKSSGVTVARGFRGHERVLRLSRR